MGQEVVCFCDVRLAVRCAGPDITKTSPSKGIVLSYVLSPWTGKEAEHDSVFMQ